MIRKIKDFISSYILKYKLNYLVKTNKFPKRKELKKLAEKLYNYTGIKMIFHEDPISKDNELSFPLILKTNQPVYENKLDTIYTYIKISKLTK